MCNNFWLDLGRYWLVVVTYYLFSFHILLNPIHSSFINHIYTLLSLLFLYYSALFSKKSYVCSWCYGFILAMSGFFTANVKMLAMKTFLMKVFLLVYTLEPQKSLFSVPNNLRLQLHLKTHPLSVGREKTGLQLMTRFLSAPGLTHLRMRLLAMFRSQAPSGNELEITTHQVLMLERAVRRQSITIVSRGGIRSTNRRTSSVEHSLLQRDKRPVDRVRTTF